jgi:Flp pilus assembly pilin Flp
MLGLLTRIQSRIVVDEDGANLIEYALLVAFIAMVAVVAVSVLGQEVSGAYDDVTQGL